MIPIKNKLKVFLGGTCNNSNWRDDFISKLKIDYFNPVVTNWTPECQQEEIRQRKKCSHIVYVITPKMKGVYSIAELIDDSNKQSEKTLFCILNEDEDIQFDESQIKSLEQVSNIAEKNGALRFYNLDAMVDYINLQGEL